MADHESPDFIVTEDGDKFGLEIVHIFKGEQNEGGSQTKEVDEYTQKNMKNLREVYEEKDDRIELDEGPDKLILFVKRDRPKARREYVGDYVGSPELNPIKKIEQAIKHKATQLSSYKECTNLDDIRLLVYADRRKDSGTLLLNECSALKLCGFRAVYFFSYPEAITAVKECPRRGDDTCPNLRSIAACKAVFFDKIQTLLNRIWCNSR